MMAFFMVSCDDPKPDDEAMSFDAWLLNEGSWGGNNASLCTLNTATGELNEHVFMQVNGRGLGDLAQDAIHYGDKLYVAVSESNTIEVVDAKTGKSLKQINMGNRYPRYMAASDGKVYVSCYTPHSVVRIDTASFLIEATCQLSDRMQPEQMCVEDDKLYVCCSWESDSTGAFFYDNRLAVVNLTDFSYSQSLEVGYNLNRIKSLGNGKVCVGYQGDYTANPSGTLLLDCATGALTPLSIALTNFDVYQGKIYGYATEYTEDYSTITAFYQVDCATGSATPILTGYSIPNAYGINVNPHTGDLYVCDSPYGANGDVYCFASDWTLRYKVGAEVYPSKLLFL